QQRDRESGEVFMNEPRVTTALLVGSGVIFGLVAGCVDRTTPTAPSTRPLASASAADGGSLVELSRPNAVGSCNTGFTAFGTWSTDEAEEPSLAVNPVDPNNIDAAWIQGPFQDIIAAASFDK